MFKREIKNQLEALFDQVDKDQLFLPENGSKKPRFLCYYNLNAIYSRLSVFKIKYKNKQKLFYLADNNESLSL